MSEISMSCLTIGELTRLCATQYDCSSCIYNCGMDKSTLETVAKRTVDTDKIVIPVSIKALFDNIPMNNVCRLAEYDCKACPLCVAVTIGPNRFGSCLYKFYNSLYAEEEEVLTSGEMLLTDEQIRHFNLEEAVVNEDDRE